jgi:hypothetical protein
MWTDLSHPNKYGHKWIAETIAKGMGLSCTSKEDALSLHDFPWPMAIAASSPFKNTFTQMPYLSYFQRVGNTLVFSINLRTKTGAVLPVANNYVVNAASTKFQQYLTAPTGPYAPLMLTDTGVISNSYSMSVSSLLTISSHVTWLDTISHSGVAGIIDPAINAI